MLLWKRCPRGFRREGGGGGGYKDEDKDLEGEAAREEASEEATMALARESTVTEELTETAEVEVNLRFWF